MVTSWVIAGVCTPRPLAPVRSRHELKHFRVYFYSLLGIPRLADDGRHLVKG